MNLDKYKLNEFFQGNNPVKWYDRYTQNFIMFFKAFKYIINIQLFSYVHQNFKKYHKLIVFHLLFLNENLKLPFSF